MITIIFSTFSRGKPKTFYYRFYKKIDRSLKEKLDVISNNLFDHSVEEFESCLDKFTPLKEKKIDLITISSRLKV